jgi:hypothetical protein
MLNVCVKYVNNQRLTHRTISGYISTNNQLLLRQYIDNWLQRSFINQTILKFSSDLSTSKITLNDLLNKSFAHNPQSLLLELINEI